ncbi:MAG: radical SAM protein [Proteobacteria bacterium]|nr:radical SAM protein [Pseudomonadota bacterium]
MTKIHGIGAPGGRDETPWIGPDGQVMRRLELHLTYTCPERCAFCSEAHRMSRFKAFPVTFGRVASVLRTHASRGVRALHITGGEPTIHPRFLDTLKLARKLGMRTSVGTIGTMLQRPAFAAEVLPFLDEALFSLHGPTAELHDELAGRPGSFDQVTAAIRTCRSLDPEFGAFVNTVLCRRNLDALPDTLRLADSLGASLIIVSNTTPEGDGYDRFDELAPRLDELTAAMAALPTDELKATLRIFGVPMCLLGEHAMLSNDMHWDPRVTVEWASKPGKVVFDDFFNWNPGRKRVHVEACASCSRKGLCQGVWDRYAELWPVDALQAKP